jgi:hypothetical protein
MMSHEAAVALFLATGLLLLNIELVRRRSLREEYALLWLLTSIVLIGLSLWPAALLALAHLLHIAYAPTALMLVGIGFILLILLQFSLVLSKLSEKNKELAQRFALMDWHTHEIENRLNLDSDRDQNGSP